MYDLQDALENNQKAIQSTPEDDPEHPKRLQNLASTYRLRYQRSGNSDDLVVALGLSQTTLKKQRQDPRGLQNLAASLTQLYWYPSNLEYLQQAPEKNEEALQLTPVGSREYLQCLQNLATSFRERYKATKHMMDLDAAMKCDEKALMFLAHTYSAEGTHKSLHFKHKEPKEGGSIIEHNLALSVKEQHDTQNDQGNLDRALGIIQSAVHLLPRDNPRRHHCLQNWALLLVAKFWSKNDARPKLGINNGGLNYLGEEHKVESLRAHALVLNLLSDVLWLGNSLSCQFVSRKTNFNWI
ncbi:hypothetical protein FB451DRAFT_1179514 [Mycena latifolia]|nr:hypothetical protein FB451DRAFT_1179514 [Mycena latifolia]